MADSLSRPIRTILITWIFLFISPVDNNLNDPNLDVNKNLYDLILSEGLTKFSSFIDYAGLANAFKNVDSPYKTTVFAFTDKAFLELPQIRKTNIEKLSYEDMKYFINFFTVFNNQISTDSIFNGKVRSNGRNQNILFTTKLNSNLDSTSTQQIYINGARIIRPNLFARNGILHIIDNVLQVTSNNMALEYIKNPEDKRAKTQKFHELITRYPIIESELRSVPRLTLFVPTDGALQDVNQEKLQTLNSDMAALRKVVQQSMIKDEVVFTSFAHYRIQGQMARDQILMYRNTYDQVSVISGESTANIVLGNLTVGNGVVHVVDKLLGYVFNTVMEQIRNDKTSSEFVSLLSLVNVGIINKALKTDNQVTLFVPTNEAFSRVAKQTETLRSNPRCLEEIIKYHIVEDLRWRLVTIGGEFDSRESMYSMARSPLNVYNFDYDRYVDGAGVKSRLVNIDIGCTNGLVQKVDRVFGIPDMDISDLILNHPWLALVPHAILRATGLQKELQDNRNTVHSARNNKYLPVNYRQCGFVNCDYTILIPNGTAYEIMMRNSVGKEILKSNDILKTITNRLIFRNKCIFMRSLPDGAQIVTSSSGDPVIFEKFRKSMKIIFGERTAKVLHYDLLATNGVVHIIDQVLWTMSDLEFGAAPRLSSGLFTITIIPLTLSLWNFH
ncbi:transforming growth factor-beta-induced protein ig-h3-like [Argonauta hians]